MGVIPTPELQPILERSSSSSSSSSSFDFQKSRMGRSAVFPAIYSQPEEPTLSQEMTTIVERTMKKYSDNLMRFLEGISSRLSQLELYCYNLDKSIGEMRADLGRDHGDADSKLKSLEKHIQEVHRSVQILRDKQELAETQKELAKLQLAQKESSSINSQHEDKAAPASDSKKNDNSSDTSNQQLALALPHQVAPQVPPPTRPVEQQPPVAPSSQAIPQTAPQQQTYYLPQTQLPNPAVQTQHPQYLPSDPQYRTPQMQELSRVSQQPAQPQVSQTAQVQSLPQYQQQWSQQFPQQVQPPQQPSMPPQVRPPQAAVYPQYAPSQPTHASPAEPLPSSMSMQVPFSSVTEAMAYGYGGTGRPGQQLPLPQPIKGNFGGQLGDRYAHAGPHPTLSPANAYVMYDADGVRAHLQPQQSHFPQGAYPPTSVPLQNPQPSPNPNLVVRNPSPPQFARNHPYNELIEKLVNMGFRADHVVSVIQRMEESGQPIDFNAVLDRLNVQSSGGT
ncbi:UBA-like domain DUF1421 [Dillenia turbinata]|uniref:UBA-like domain DUF1421 n=1 Tax=Dillenia turbinata TaxID=194707 RepID=A0AAN8UR96_9MAGN